jgi:hypothetical protein
LPTPEKFGVVKTKYILLYLRGHRPYRAASSNECRAQVLTGENKLDFKYIQKNQIAKVFLKK